MSKPPEPETRRSLVRRTTRRLAQALSRPSWSLSHVGRPIRCEMHERKGARRRDRRHLHEAVAEQLDHRGHHALERAALQGDHRESAARSGQVLERRHMVGCERRSAPLSGNRPAAILKAGRRAARRSRWHPRNRPRSARPDSESSRASPCWTQSGARGSSRQPARRSPSQDGARSRRARARRRRPRSGARHRTSPERLCRRPVTSPAETRHHRPWRARTSWTVRIFCFSTKILHDPNGLVSAR